MLTIWRCFTTFFRFVFAVFFPSRCIGKLYAELARLDYTTEWREFRTLAGTRFWITSSVQGPKLKTLKLEPFFVRLRRNGDNAGRIIIECRDEKNEWKDYRITESAVRDELRFLRELFAFHPCLPSEEGFNTPSANAGPVTVESMAAVQAVTE